MQRWQLLLEDRKRMVAVSSLCDGKVRSSHVELDEAHVGGHRPGKRRRGAAGKVIVVGM
jgi:transposase